MKYIDEVQVWKYDLLFPVPSVIYDVCEISIKGREKERRMQLIHDLLLVCHDINWKDTISYQIFCLLY